MTLSIMKFASECRDDAARHTTKTRLVDEREGEPRFAKQLYTHPRATHRSLWRGLSASSIA